VEQAQRLIRDLLDVQKVEAGKLVLNRERVDVSELIGDVLQTLQPVIDEKELSILRATNGRVSPVHADADRVSQIFSNILVNAIKFSPPGAEIAVTSEQLGNEVVVSVRDEGPGIAEDELPHVFDRYWQARHIGKVGHGIGLSIVQALSRAHGGRAWAESRFGYGSTFYFALPVFKDPSGS
jgi:signal transduction histidine kinase